MPQPISARNGDLLFTKCRLDVFTKWTQQQRLRFLISLGNEQFSFAGAEWKLETFKINTSFFFIKRKVIIEEHPRRGNGFSTTGRVRPSQNYNW